MKKTLLLLLTLVLALTLAITLASCGEPTPQGCGEGNHSFNLGTTTKEPTCDEDGQKTLTCLVCGETKIETIEASGEHEWDSGEITTAPTCGTAGLKTVTCEACGATQTEPVAATGLHALTDGEITLAPTCAATGKMSRPCQNCEYVGEKSLPMLTTHTPATELTKGDAGHYHACTVCGIPTDETPHTWDEGTVTTQPVGCTPGEKTATCTACGKTDSVPVPGPDPHTTTGVVDGAQVVYTCSVCENAYSYEVKKFYNMEGTDPFKLIDNKGAAHTDAPESTVHVAVRESDGNKYLTMLRVAEDAADNIQAQNNNTLMCNATSLVFSMDIMAADEENTNASFSFHFYNGGGSWGPPNTKGQQFIKIVGKEITTFSGDALGTLSATEFTNIRAEIEIGENFEVDIYVNDAFVMHYTLENNLLNGASDRVYVTGTVKNQNTGFYFDNILLATR